MVAGLLSKGQVKIMADEIPAQLKLDLARSGCGSKVPNGPPK
jgi:hypothetical protein